MLLGYCDRQAFQDTSFSWWFNSVYDMYEFDSTTALGFKDKLSNIKITVVMGTWCSDSRRVVPKFLRVLDFLNYPKDSVSILTVGRNKKGRGNETDNMKIDLVPTIIFYRNNMEIGRIVESPKETIEKDITKILGS
jgi:thiol-disulfide isomerase/thioredoxin